MPSIPSTEITRGDISPASKTLVKALAQAKEILSSTMSVELLIFHLLFVSKYQAARIIWAGYPDE